MLGSGTASYADEEFTDTGATPIEHVRPGTAVPVSVASTGAPPDAASAVLTVVQLVNE